MDLHRHHHQSPRTRRTARVIRWLAIALCALAVADFGYNAYLTGNCFADNSDPLSRDIVPRIAVNSEECRVLIANRDLHGRVDALAVLLAIALLVASAVVLSRQRRRTRRLLLGVEASVVVLILAYSTLWVLAWH
jgi:predicted nucleic acid-binding Zn ribbon protein